MIAIAGVFEYSYLSLLQVLFFTIIIVLEREVKDFFVAQYKKLKKLWLARNQLRKFR
jgi:hypothetical protein